MSHTMTVLSSLWCWGYAQALAVHRSRNEPYINCRSFNPNTPMHHPVHLYLLGLFKSERVTMQTPGYVRTVAYPDRTVEWMFSCMMVSWGLWLLVPTWNTFDNPNYAMLKQLADESTWGVWSVMVGVVRMAALYINGSHRRTPLIRLICSTLGMIWWLVLIYLFLLSAPAVGNPAAGFSWYPIFVIFEGISCWRATADGWHTEAFRSSRKVESGGLARTNE